MSERRGTAAIAAVFLGMVVSSAWSAVIVVDDHRDDCVNSQFASIQDALNVANVGDEVRVCPGLYEEQLTILDPVTLRGQPVGTRRVVVRPPALDPTRARKSVLTGNPIVAGIMVDTTTAAISDIDLDLSNNGLPACLPMLAGIYFRNASGSVQHSLIENVTLSAGQCESGVGLYVETGSFGLPFGVPTSARAIVSVRETRFLGHQKAGVAANGPRTFVRVQGGEAAGSGGAAIPAQYGYQLGLEARGRLQEVDASGYGSGSPDAQGAGVLVFQSSRSKQKGTTVVDGQIGVFLAGDKNRVSNPRFDHLSAVGAVVLGLKSKVASAAAADIGQAGFVVDGDRNVIRGGSLTDAPIGVCIRGGVRNKVRGIALTNVPQANTVCPASLEYGLDSVTPFLAACKDAGDCDDGNACTADTCTNGTCSNEAVVDGSACEDGSACTAVDECQAGICTPGPAVSCDDGAECNGVESCSPAIGCVSGTSLPDGSPCAGGTCTAGVCS